MSDPAPPSEPRGVAEVLLRLPVERPTALSRDSISTPPLDLRDFDQQSAIDEKLLAAVDARWVEFAPGLISETTTDEPLPEIIEALESCRRQMIVRVFRRPEQDVDPVRDLLKREAGATDPLGAREPIPWWTFAPPFSDWGVEVIRQYQLERREWVWCDASKQRVIRRTTDVELDEVVTDRLRERRLKEEAERLEEKFRDMARSRGRQQPGGGKMKGP